MEVFGRDDERALIGAWLEGVSAGGGTMLLEGGAGIGKTTLLSAAIEDARARGLRILQTQPTQAEQGMSFAGLADLLEPILDEVLDDLPDVQREALEVALLRRAGARAADPRTVGAATLSGLRAATRGGALLVAVDDVQWLDPATERTLGFALRRLDGIPAGVLLARRAAPGRMPPPLGYPEEAIRRLGVEAIDEDAAGTLLASRLDWRPPPRLLRRVTEISGGNPLFVLELGRALRDRPEPVPGEPLPVPERLRDLVLARLRRLTPSHRDVLLVAAALRAPTLALVRAAVDGDQVHEALDEAEEASLIERRGEHLVFGHPLYASVLYGSSRSSRRRAVHARLAEVVTDPEERARHLAAAATGPDAAVADALEQAARHAHAQGAPDPAAELADMARALTPEAHHDDRWRRELLTAEYRIDILDLARAAELLDRLVGSDAPKELRATAMSLLARMDVRTDAQRGIELLERALELLGPGETLLHARLTYVLTVAVTNARNAIEAIDHGERAMAMAARLGEPQAEAQARLYTIHSRLIAGRGLDRAELARTPTVETGMRSPYWRGAFLMWAGDHGAARQELERVRAYLDQVGDEFERLATDLFFAELTWRDGDWARAFPLAQTALDETTRSGQAPLSMLAVPSIATMLAARGDIAEARELVERVAEAATASFLPARFLLGWARGLIELADDQPAAMVQVLGPLFAESEQAGFLEHGVLPFRPDLIEALIRTGDLALAGELLDLFESRAPYANEPWASIGWLRCRALLASARSDPAAALEASTQAVAQLEQLPVPFEVARTMTIHGAVLRRAKRKRPAREALDRAATMFDELGAQVFAERARGELARVGGARPELSTDLSPTEQRIADLVAEGLTNQQIAAALSVAVRTVESNLTRIYRKVGVRRRAELIGRARGTLQKR